MITNRNPKFGVHRTPFKHKKNPPWLLRTGFWWTATQSTN